MWAGEQIKEKYYNICHLKTTGQNNKIFNVHILGTHMHIHTKYEVSILSPVARRAVHRCQRRRQMMPTPDNNYVRRTNHDYIGSFV